MKLFLLRLYEDQSAVTSIEYAMLASLIAVVIAVGVASAGSELLQLYTNIKDQVVLATK